MMASESAGFSAAGLDGVRATNRENLPAKRELSVLVAVAQRNRLIMFEAFGVRDPATGEPARREDIHRLMSTTKEVTAISVLMLADTGQLNIDDNESKVSAYIF